jgi:hypothetical protein
MVDAVQSSKPVTLSGENKPEITPKKPQMKTVPLNYGPDQQQEKLGMELIAAGPQTLGNRLGESADAYWKRQKGLFNKMSKGKAYVTQQEVTAFQRAMNLEINGLRAQRDKSPLASEKTRLQTMIQQKERDLTTSQNLNRGFGNVAGSITPDSYVEWNEYERFLNNGKNPHDAPAKGMVLL